MDERPEAAEDLDVVPSGAVCLNVAAAQMDLRDRGPSCDRAIDVGQDDASRRGELVGEHAAVRAQIGPPCARATDPSETIPMTSASSLQRRVSARIVSS